MTQLLAQFQIAVMMLTRLPAGQLTQKAPSVAMSVWAFPLIGILIGGIGAAFYLGASRVGLSPLIASTLAIAACVLATGALHEDGLADMAYGFGGGHSRERKLEIMRDSRIGSYGVVALILVFLLRVLALSEIANPVVAFVAVGAFSRALMPVLMRALPSARADGLGHSAGRPSAARVAVSLVLGGLTTIVLGSAALSVLIGMVLVALTVGFVAKRQVGGQTGDVLGATQLLTEVSGWMILAALT